MFNLFVQQKCLCYFLLTFILCETVTSQNSKQCGKFEWKCNNGECIASDELCDGNRDCADGSDETAASCVHVRCPSFAFRCAYGGCVNGDSECNGVSDCADNSDETSALCPGVATNFKLSGNCLDDQFQCDSGKCISIDNACDGKVHCDDGSDETVKLCASAYCPSYAFRCGYGGCISGSAKCDGVLDCADGSDESPILCGRGHTTESPGVGVTGTTRRPRPKPTPTTSLQTVPGSGCQANYHPNLIFVYESDHNDEIQTGEYVQNFITIAYKCRPKHILDGQKTNICVNDKWLTEHPTCSKYCSNVIITGVTIQSTCELNGKRISCNQPLRSGTRAIISCQIGYQKPDRVVQEVLVCGENGEWDYHPFRCEQVCGTESIETFPFLIGGEKINNTLVPWHVPIFALKIDRYVQICAGTIINAKIVVSAAHCFWDIRTEKPYDKSLFAVAAGKYYRDYYAKEPQLTQFFNLSDLHIPPGYQDVLLSYQNDIAVLVLNNFIEFKPYIKPICIEWQNYSNRSLKSNLYGRVAGWGKTETGNPSDELRVVDLPTVSYEECIEKTEPRYRTLVTGDKFCVSTTDKGQYVCEGDSGGGFFLPKTVAGLKTYFLWGIVSNGLNSKGECSGSFFTAFTNIQYHSSMIIEYETKYRPK